MPRRCVITMDSQGSCVIQKDGNEHKTSKQGSFANKPLRNSVTDLMRSSRGKVAAEMEGMSELLQVQLGGPGQKALEKMKFMRLLAVISLVGILPEHTMAIGSESCGSFYQDPSCREDCGSCGTIFNSFSSCEQFVNTFCHRSAMLYCSVGNRNSCFRVRKKAASFCF
jgi:hypothetical protein